MPADLAVAEPGVAVSERRLRAMGTDALLVAVGDPRLTAVGLAVAVGHLQRLEARWSRFRPHSDVCRIRSSAGRPVAVDPCTAELVTAAVAAWHATGGRFDPTVLPALERLGYDRTFPLVARHGDPDAPLLDGGPDPAPGCGGVVVDLDASTVSVPEGVALDLGGIGKGRAADLIARALLDGGADGALVDLGGDIRVAGRPPAGDHWAIAVDRPDLGRDPGAGDGAPVDGGPVDDAGPLTVVRLADGAVVTTARTRRHWRRDGVEQHHLIDPATGLPSRSGLAAVTVVAAGATDAEVMAKAAFLAGEDDGAALIEASGVASLLVTDDGRVRRAGPMEVFER